jgi:hypothetical protein
MEGYPHADEAPEPHEQETRSAEDIAAAVAEILEQRQAAYDSGPRRLSRFDTRVTETLPGRDPELAAVLYATMAASQSRRDRDDVAVRIDLLYVADRESGLGLWLDLMGDPHPVTADHARHTLSIALEEDSEIDVLPEDAEVLRATYEEAEQTRLPISDEELEQEDREEEARLNREDERDGFGGLSHEEKMAAYDRWAAAQDALEKRPEQG